MRAPSVNELKGRLTYGEFLDWLEYLKWEERRNTKLDFYLASITAELRRSYVANPKSVKMSDFLIELVDSVQSDKVTKSKQTWLSAVGVKRK